MYNPPRVVRVVPVDPVVLLVPLLLCTHQFPQPTLPTRPRIHLELLRDLHPLAPVHGAIPPGTEPILRQVRQPREVRRPLVLARRARRELAHEELLDLDERREPHLEAQVLVREARERVRRVGERARGCGEHAGGGVALALLLLSVRLGHDVEDEVDRAHDVQLDNCAPDYALGAEGLAT